MKYTFTLLIVLFLVSITVSAQTIPAAKETKNVGIVLEKQRIPESISVFKVEAEEWNREKVIEYIKTISSALKIDLNWDSLKDHKEENPEVFRFHFDRDKFTLFGESGGLEYRNRMLYQLGPKDVGPGAPPKEKLLAWADRDIRQLAEARLLNPEELDRDLLHITHQMTQVGERKDGKVKMEQAISLDNRIDFTRRLGQLRVAGNGIRLIYSNDGKLLGLDFVWRKLKSDSQQLQIVVNAKEATETFREHVDIPGSEVELMQAELLFLDPDPRFKLEGIHPTYLFLYRIKTPAKQKDEFIVGKKQFFKVSPIKETRSATPSEKS